ncbi:MAG TPA: L-rhamnonate dehydratase [Gaiellaceae bacterium]|nr:L-rhamnonate dehydratase [Gaiellaceae bacterium]
MSAPTIRAVRAHVQATRADARPAFSPGHWILDTRIAGPMSRWPEYRADRRSWGIDALGGAVVEVETSSGTTGVAPCSGGLPAALLVEGHLARFLAGRELSRESIEEIWEQLYRATLPYGRRGLALFAISALDLALWDALGKERGEPVWALLGEKRHERLPLYATTPRPDAARALGFRGGKLPLPASPAEGDDGLAENLALAARLREACGDPDEFFLAVDCWMSLDVPYATRLGEGLAGLGFRWLEEPLLPDDYAGHAELRRRLGGAIALAAGEHEATRWGFELLLEQGCVDLVQPDVGWCGGLTELLRIAEVADARGVPVVPHGSSVYSYHFCAVRPETEFAEFLLLDPEGVEIVPQLAPLLLGEPLPEDGHVRVPDDPGFGVALNHELELARPERYR